MGFEREVKKAFYLTDLEIVHVSSPQTNISAGYLKFLRHPGPGVLN